MVIGTKPYLLTVIYLRIIFHMNFINHSDTSCSLKIVSYFFSELRHLFDEVMAAIHTDFNDPLYLLHSIILDISKCRLFAHLCPVVASRQQFY